MTDGDDSSPTPTRRRFLAGTATALAAGTAGCGYVPGGGDLAWEEPIRTGGLAFESGRWYRPTANRLVTIENQSGQAYDFEEAVWREVSNAAVAVLTPDGIHRAVGETERQVTAPPAVADDAAFLSVEDGRLTALDLSAGETADSTAGGATTSESDGDAVRWRVDVGARLGAGTDGGDQSSGPVFRGVRASDALAVAIGGKGIAAFDAETGEKAFVVPDLWTDASSDGTLADPTPRVAVDGETAWVLVPAAAADSDGDAAIVGYDRAGDRRVERSVATVHRWLVAVDGTVVIGAPGASMAGFDGDFDRRFALDAPASSARPTAGRPDDGRFYYSRSRTVTAVDVEAGEVAFEWSESPPDHLAVGAAGLYVAENAGGFDDDTEARVVAIGDGGRVLWEAPLPDRVDPERLFAIGDRLVVVDDGTAYGFRATSGERWSPLG
ncbi:hypothetical protein C463_17493 [Halorubrum californiense DSM 19288]|uniref:Pyrrolo-quinoline quinone n=1 Tax=Halorubrum californiense DSM 19288 TaxID=1227465 RepID=M0DWE1_9EURY|nr:MULTISPECIES: PQQ-binding-like beta-propeller repeat protein [Halorubrum]ELZ39133.1 hypothetical protein C463_17493 [Halorubrum californiense DSM 19288]TKX71975.1 hypothetical protein EXE40_05690 [Halorubrum sp. GN11GM_10-3_MGM]